MNEVSLIGRAGSAPEIVSFPNGDKLARFSLAIQERKFQKKGVSSAVNWQKIVAWGNKAELMEKYIKKGQLVLVEGKMTNKSINRNGVPMRISEILCQNFMMLNQSNA